MFQTKFRRIKNRGKQNIKQCLQKTNFKQTKHFCIKLNNHFFDFCVYKAISTLNNFKQKFSKFLRILAASEKNNSVDNVLSYFYIRHIYSVLYLCVFHKRAT